MHRSIALLLSACVFAGPAHAQSFSPERIRSDVAFLADDLLEGRGTGTRGYDLAARYVASRFEALGLQPGTADGWYQNVPFITFSADPTKSSSITFGGKSFANADHVLVGPSILGETVEGTADAVFVGYGLEDKRYGLDDYRGLDVRGKIAVSIYGTPEGLPSDVAATLSEKKPDLAAAKGAIGTIVILTPGLLKRFPWGKILENSALPRMRWAHPDGRPDLPNPTLRLGASLDPTAAEQLFANTPLAGGKLAALLADPKARPKGFAIPGKVRIERFSKIDKVRSPNVIGMLPGSDPTLANEVVLLSAHLDHLGIVTGKNGDTIANGAMDNASGVATMMEVARAFVESGQRPKRSVMFVALTGEEKGLFGSEYLATYPSLPGKRVVANVNLDMPILTYDFTDVIAFGAEHSTVGEAVARAAAAERITLSPDPEPEEQFFVRSDHYSFVKKGVPALSLDTGQANGGKEAGEAFRRARYHDVSDDMTQKINWQAGAKFARLNYLVARDLADAAQAPRWYAGDFFGDQFAKGQPKAPKP
ncbi:MAG: M20/M25/M40 family metallo-hydrolase [Sphingomicrobium sp.]